MSTLFDRVELTGLRKAHLQQLLWYLEDRDHDRRYAGNREQFEQRHEDLRSWLKSAVNCAYSEGVVMPGDRKR